MDTQVFEILKITLGSAGFLGIATGIAVMIYRTGKIVQRIESLEVRSCKQEESMNKGFEKVDERFKEMDTKLDKRFNEMDAKFDKRCNEMDAKFDKRCNEMESRFDKRFNEMGAKFDKRCDGIENRFDKRCDEIVEQLDIRCNDMVKQSDKNFKEVGERLRKIEDNLPTINIAITRMEVRLEERTLKIGDFSKKEAINWEVPFSTPPIPTLLDK